MRSQLLNALAFATTGALFSTLFVSSSVNAQGRNWTAQSVQQRYGIHDAYDGTTLHPDGHHSAAVPVTLEDGRTGEFVVPSGRADSHPVYYRDDQTGDMHPVRMDPHATRQQIVEGPRALRYQPEPEHRGKPSWEQDALIVGGSAAGGALIGAAAGGAKGAGVGAAAGGVGGLIYDLLKNKR
jgi:hypothetical protein